MTRRGFLVALLFSAGNVAHAQGERIRVVGYLSTASEAGRRHRDFRDDLHKLGYLKPVPPTQPACPTAPIAPPLNPHELKAAASSSQR